MALLKISTNLEKSYIVKPLHNFIPPPTLNIDTTGVNNMRNVPTQKSLRILYPTITPRTAKLCREIMRAQLDPLDRPDMFPKTRDLFTVDFIPTPPRMIRMLAIAELCKAEPDLNPDAPICAHYGVCYPAQYTSHTA